MKSGANTAKSKKVSPRRRYSFWIHYNKPLSREAKVPVWTVHYRGKCHNAELVMCKTNTSTRARKRQPFGVMTGKASELEQNGKLILLK